MGGDTTELSPGALISDLETLRRAGLAGARHHRLPALQQAAGTVLAASAVSTARKIEELLLLAISELDQGDYGDAALALFGLDPGGRGKNTKDRREAAAEHLGRRADTFQRSYESDLLADVADRIIGLCEDQQLRDARTQLERRHPAESRLAVQWVERFEAYYRIWTPAWALGAELTAYRSTLLEPDRPYDREPGTFGPDDPGYTQEKQAEGYAVYALYRWAWLQWHQRQFMLQHGGMWLLSTTEAETKAGDLLYEIDWHVTVFNERDQSWLRNLVSQTRGQELDHFQSMLTSTVTGTERLGEWLIWCGACQCTWDTNADTEGRWPTSATEPGIAETCQLHKVVAACDVYCALIDDEWLKIADWYHLDATYRRGVRSEEMYREWRTRTMPGT